MESLTILVPVYNEEESLLKFKEEMDHFLENTPLETSVLFINDGSTDESYSIIKNITRQDERYSCISLITNCGLSTALKAGIDYVTTPWVGYIDADLQTSPMDFLKFLPFMEEFDLINGIRVHRQDTFVKRLSSKIANNFRRWMINDGIEDTCCPLKIMKTRHAQNIPFFKGMHRFIPALFMLKGAKVKQLQVQHFERYAGTAKYHLTNRLVGPFLDTLAFAWMKKRNIRYTIQDKEMVTTFIKEKQLA